MRIRLSEDEAKVLRSCVEAGEAMKDLDGPSPFVGEGQLPPEAPPAPQHLGHIRDLVERPGVAEIDELVPTDIVMKWRDALIYALEVDLVSEGDRKIAERALRKLRHRKYSGGAISMIASESSRGLAAGPRRDHIFAALGIRAPNELANDALLIERRLSEMNGTQDADQFIDLVSSRSSLRRMLLTDAAYDVEERDPPA